MSTILLVIIRPDRLKGKYIFVLDVPGGFEQPAYSTFAYCMPKSFGLRHVVTRSSIHLRFRLFNLSRSLIEFFKYSLSVAYSPTYTVTLRNVKQHPGVGRIYTTVLGR